MKLFNIHSGSRGLPRFIKGMDWATGLFLRTPSRRGARELVKKPHPLAVNRNRRLNNVALLVPLRSAQFSSVFFCSPTLYWVLLLCSIIYSKFSSEKGAKPHTFSSARVLGTRSPYAHSTVRGMEWYMYAFLF